MHRICAIIGRDIIFKPRTGLEFGSQDVAFIEEEDDLCIGKEFGRIDHFPE